MEKLQPAKVVSIKPKDFIAAYMANGATREQAKTAYNLNKQDAKECWKNEIYTVLVIRETNEKYGFLLPEGMVWLSIKRNDREPIFDWREVQEIKNQLLGEDCEAVQLFPANSRLVDTSNQYHLIGLLNPKERFLFGFVFRAVNDAPFLKSKQREFAK